MNDNEFEQWYVENAFDYAANPIGSRDCSLMRKAWKAALAARPPVGQHSVVTEAGELPCSLAVAPEWQKREEYIAEMELRLGAQPMGPEPVAWVAPGEIFAARRLFERGIADGAVQVRIGGQVEGYDALYPAPPAPAAVPVDGLREALRIHNEGRTTLQGLASSVGDFLRACATHPQPAEAKAVHGPVAHVYDAMGEWPAAKDGDA